MENLITNDYKPTAPDTNSYFLDLVTPTSTENRETWIFRFIDCDSF